MLNQELIIKGCIEGDRKCQQKLYETHYSKMMVVCLRYAKDRDEALDMFQEAFIKVFEKLHKYTNKGSLEGWIRRIMVNTSIDHIRKNKINNQMIEIEDRHVGFTEEEEDKGLLEHINFEGLLALVQNLSPAYQSVFNMYVVDGFSHAEIAEELGISVGTSKSNLAKAKINLRKMLQERLSKVAG